MKRYLGFAMILIFCFSFASCSAKNPQAPVNIITAAPVVASIRQMPLFETVNHSKEFKDENGRVVFTVNASIPEIVSYDNMASVGTVNIQSLDKFEAACDFAENNIEAAANFMDSNNTPPWSKKIDFEISFSNGHYVSIVFSEEFSMYGKETEPTFSSLTFDVLTGTQCSLFDFVTNNYSNKETVNIIIDNHLCHDISEKFFYGQELTDEQQELVHKIFLTENFFLTSNGVSFILNNYWFDAAKNGDFVCSYSWNELSAILKLPD